MRNLASVFEAFPHEEDREPPDFVATIEIVHGAALISIVQEAKRVGIICERVVSLDINADTWVDSLAHVVDPAHPLLRQFGDEQLDLFFRGKPRDSSRLIGDLWVAHQRCAHAWIPFERYFNDVRPELFEIGFGSCARGPRFLLDAYAAVLREHGIEPDIVEHGKDGPQQQRVPDEAIVFEAGHVVALAYEIDYVDDE